MSGFKFYYFF